MGTASAGIRWDPARGDFRGSCDRARRAWTAEVFPDSSGRTWRTVTLRYRHERGGVWAAFRAADFRLAAEEQRRRDRCEEKGIRRTLRLSDFRRWSAAEFSRRSLARVDSPTSDELAGWAGPHVDALKVWAGGVRHLRCPRHLVSSPFLAPERSPESIGSDGRDAPLALAADDALMDSVRNWYRNTFGVRIDIVAQGSYSNLVTRTPVRDYDVRIAQSGSWAVPRSAGCGYRAVSASRWRWCRHHRASGGRAPSGGACRCRGAPAGEPRGTRTAPDHRDTFGNGAAPRSAVGRGGRLPAEDVLVYWIHAEPARGSILEKIGIRENGEMATWPDGVFTENYEEILAIRRAARR